MKMRFPLFSLIISCTICTASGVPAAGAEDPSATKSVLARITQEVQAEQISDQSFQQIQDLVEKDPNNYQIRLLLGQCLEALGLPEQAIEQFNLAVKLAPNAPEPVAALIKAKLKGGKTKEGEDLIANARVRFPKSPEILFWVGNYYTSKNQLGPASKLYEEALSKGKVVVGLPTAMAEIYLSRAQQVQNPYISNAYYGQAISLANLDLKSDSKLGTAYFVKGMALMKMGKIAEAITPLQTAFDANPKNHELELAVARCQYWSGNYAGAFFPACAYVAEEQNTPTGNKDPKQILASILSRMSESQIKKSLEDIFSRPIFKQNPQFHFTLGKFLDARNLHALATEQFKETVALAPDFGDAWFRLGYNQEKYERNYEAAQESYKSALRYQGGNATVANYLRRLGDRLGQRKDDLAWQLRDKLLRLRNASTSN